MLTNGTQKTSLKGTRNFCSIFLGLFWEHTKRRHLEKT